MCVSFCIWIPPYCDEINYAQTSETYDTIPSAYRLFPLDTHSWGIQSRMATMNNKSLDWLKLWIVWMRDFHKIVKWFPHWSVRFTSRAANRKHARYSSNSILVFSRLANQCFIHVLFLFTYLFSLLHIMHFLFCVNGCWLFESMEYSYRSMLSTILNTDNEWLPMDQNGRNQPIYLHTAYHQHNNYYTKYITVTVTMNTNT